MARKSILFVFGAKTYFLLRMEQFVQVAKRHLISLPFATQARIKHTSFAPFGGAIDAAFSILNVCLAPGPNTTDQQSPPLYFVLDGNHRVGMVEDDFIFSCRVVELDINDAIAVADWSLKMNSAAAAVQRVMNNYIDINKLKFY